MSRRVIALLIIVGVVVVGVVGWSLTRPDDARAQLGESARTPAIPARSAGAATDAVDDPVVLAISVDGLNPDAITELGPRVPNLKRLIDDGAATLNARTDHDITVTLPNHTGMVTGRHERGDDGHSVTFNGDQDTTTLTDVHGAYVPSMFDVAHDRGVHTALFAAKPKFTFLVRSFDEVHGAVDVTGADDGRDKIDVNEIGSSLSEADDLVTSLTGEGKRLVFWHVPNPDAIGHAAGWMTDPYLVAVTDADRVIGDVIAEALKTPGMADRLTVLLTADHGGPQGQKAHDDATLAANYTIPFIAWGAQTGVGEDLYDLNADREDPGTGRPDFTGAQPVRNIDVADTALRLLGLPSIPDAAGSRWPALRLR